MANPVYVTRIDRRHRCLVYCQIWPSSQLAGRTDLSKLAPYRKAQRWRDRHFKRFYHCGNYGRAAQSGFWVPAALLSILSFMSDRFKISVLFRLLFQFGAQPGLFNFNLARTPVFLGRSVAYHSLFDFYGCNHQLL